MIVLNHSPRRRAKKVSISDLYLAFRQAKVAHFYERRGVGLVALAEFEANLQDNLESLQAVLNGNGGWFDNLDVGTVWVTPKRLRRAESKDDGVTRIGSAPTDAPLDIDVQLRCTPSPEFAIVEVLFLWRFGAILEAQLSPDVIGYRLAHRGHVRETSRWLFEYWPKRYQEFRSAPLNYAKENLKKEGVSTLILSADLASFYDTIDPSFMGSSAFIDELGLPDSERREYAGATKSLLRAYARFRAEAELCTGLQFRVGVPIGPLTSRIVANLALAPLDAHISRQPGVLCYRRYVDDLVVIGNAENEQDVTLESVVRRFIPLTESRAGVGPGVLALDVEALQRRGSEFSLQKKKVRVHQLTGAPGRDFIQAVAHDFQKLVSERRAFLDPEAGIEATTNHLVRTSKVEGSPLRVLRDADRARLERFAVSTNLQALERISSLVDRHEAEREVRRHLDQVLRVLNDGEENWVENLSLLLRLLRLAVATHDGESVVTLTARTDNIPAGRLFFRDHPVDLSTARASLRDYVHELRLEAVCGSLPAVSELFADGLGYQDGRLEPQRLEELADHLAATDLRAMDREDDTRRVSSPTNDETLSKVLSKDLRKRMALIEKFTASPRSSQWPTSPRTLFLCTRPPSYFDIAHRWLADVQQHGFKTDVFVELLSIVNAVRGTKYADPVGSVDGPNTVSIPPTPIEPTEDPLLILGNLVSTSDHWTAAVGKAPIHSLDRLRSLARLLRDADRRSRISRTGRDILKSPNSVLVLPELSVPRGWFRAVAAHVVRLNQHGLIIGLEYEHGPTGTVENQVHAVLPGPFRSAASWPWTKGFPADEEGRELKKKGLKFPMVHPRAKRPARTVVHSSFGTFSVLICSELLETPRIADLLGRVELVFVPSWNTDTASYDHVVQSVGLLLHTIVAVANNGYYSDSRAWAPRATRWQRDLCRLIERGQSSIVAVKLPLSSLRNARLGVQDKDGWKPLPPDW